MDERLQEKTDKYIRVASVQIENKDTKCLLEIIKLQAQRISDLESHMEFALNKIQKLCKETGISEE